MRLVVILFAESRELLPRENPLYHESYGLNGLFERLERDAAHGAAMAENFSAWPRVLALFRLVREGSHHPDLPVTTFGGDLFAPGSRDGDGLSRALAVFENACFEDEALPDGDLFEMLKLLTRTTIRIRQGRGATRTVVPVDFSDLSSEYIGILYEGLLDYELKTAPAGDPVIFLTIGHQPALPLSRLEAMEDSALRALFESLGKDASTSDEAAETAEQEENPGLSEIHDASDADVAEAPPPTDAVGGDEHRQNRTRAETWARHAALTAKLVKKPRKGSAQGQRAFEEKLAARARQLVGRVVLPGEWYLVRWGGTRKGSGSFYTRPGLAVPTVQRTLRPLAYDPPLDADGKPHRDAPPTEWNPKPPEQILEIKACDPASGSGTFPLAALRFLTDALYASLQHHQRIEPDGERTIVRLLGIGGAGTSADSLCKETDAVSRAGDKPKEERSPESHATNSDRLGDELIPCPPDDDEFEPRLKAVLRRHVVERCIYAVDLDPLAVELCRLSLWIETMDRTLPFGFLDHKVKCGNALIGAWFNQFQHYPAMAWKNRDGGDKNHSNGVHFQKNARTRAIKAFVKETLTPDLQLFLQGADLFQEDLLEKAAAVHDDALAVLADMHAMPVQDAAERARKYREEFLASPARGSIKSAMDLWCACWFWPADELEYAPLPSSFVNPPNETRATAERIADKMRFFHWELEYPDVFCERGSGFDAILGNPPWENLQPNPEEFFSNVDPLFRSYNRGDKLSRQRSLFSDDQGLEKQYLDYISSFNDMSNWVGACVNPFGDPQMGVSNKKFPLGRGGNDLHNRWRAVRQQSCSYADSNHPFRHQLGRIFTYKLFLEYSLALMRSGGRLGMIVPSGTYSDAWSRPLRKVFLEHCRWEWLFGIENREKVFPIHSSFKFNPVIVEKGGATEAIRTAFMRRNLEDWERAEDLATPYTLHQVERFSPKSSAILEIQSARDLEVLEKIYANAVLLGDDSPDGWQVKYRLEYMMNTDARLFPPRPRWEEKGYRPDEYSRWLLGNWRPINELWTELRVDPSRPEPMAVELEEWLFDATAGAARREAEARFVHGRLLKPGDVTRTDWSVRCAQPPYDRLPVARANIPEGVVLSREGDAWIREDEVEDVALPLYEGRMIGQFDFSQKGWVSGKGRGAVWREIPWERKQVEPQYLMGVADFHSSAATPHHPKVCYMRVGSATNERTAIGSFIWGTPAGDTAASIYLPTLERTLALAAVLNSLAFDFVTRARLIGLHFDYHVLEQNPLPTLESEQQYRTIATKAAQLNLISARFSPWRIRLGESSRQTLAAAWTHAERARCMAILNALLAAVYGLNKTDLVRIVNECDLPQKALQMPKSSSLDPKGFWRIDKDKPPELRRTVLTLIAFHDLESKIEAANGDRDQGIEAFLNQNHGEGWMLPETLRLADYSLGHDERAKHTQPVASRLGPRFYDWQLAQTTEEAWRECHTHARNLLGADAYEQLSAGKLIDLDDHRRHPDSIPAREDEALPQVAEPETTYQTDTPPKEGQADLFK